MNIIFNSIDLLINKLIAEKPVEPQSHYTKTKILKEYADKYSLSVFIETGTYLGDTINALRDDFRELVSIELSESLFNKALERFSGDKRISILRGDSGAVIEPVLYSLKEPALFWLDGHYSGGITAKGELDTPIKKELVAILNHHIKNHVILVDDARCFTGENDYPTIKELLHLTSRLASNMNAEVKDDIIRICPNNTREDPSVRLARHSYRESWHNKAGRIYRKSKKILGRLIHGKSQI